MFSSVCALSSPASAEGCCPSLFGWFTGTTTQSDFSCTFMSAVRFMAFADRSCSFVQDVQEISRFSCMLFLSVRGFLDYAGPNNPLAITWLLCCLPPLGRESASCSIGFSKLNSPAHRYLCLRFKRHLAISPARLEARMDSLFSFPVGLFHPLQHAGLSRRSPVCRPSGSHHVIARMERRVRPILPSSESGCDQGHSEECREAGSEEQLLKDVRHAYNGKVVAGQDLEIL
jgi:hypothetical protein